MENKTEQLNIRVTKKERDRIEYLSSTLGYKYIGDYIRKAALNLENKNNKVKVINTLTLNPALDMVVEIDELKTLSKYDINDVEYIPGGKGINVSQVINQFNTPTTALHYSGSFTGEYIKTALEELNINQIMFNSTYPTRINIKLNIDDTETKEINGGATFVPLKIQKQILKTISNFEAGENLVITGSFHEDNKEFLIDISRLCQIKKVIITYDLSHPILLELLKFEPLLIKPNIYELDNIFGKKHETEKDIFSSMQKLNELGAKNVAITLGAKGSLFLNEHNEFYRSEIINKIKKVSSQGAGDSFVGAYLSNLHLNMDELLKISNAAGAATTASKKIASYDAILEMVENIKISKIN